MYLYFDHFGNKFASYIIFYLLFISCFLLQNHREKLREKYSKLLIEELLSKIVADQYPSSMKNILFYVAISSILLTVSRSKKVIFWMKSTAYFGFPCQGLHIWKVAASSFTDSKLRYRFLFIQIHHKSSCFHTLILRAIINSVLQNNFWCNVSNFPLSPLFCNVFI